MRIDAKQLYLVPALAIVAALALACGGLALAAPASASPSWLAPEVLDSVPSGGLPDIAVDAGGDAVAAWHGVAAGKYVAQAATRPAGGTWSAPVTVSPPQTNTTPPDVAMGADGKALVVWATYDGRVQVSGRPPGGDWSAPETLSAPGATGAWGRAAFGSDGSATVIWTDTTSPHYEVMARARPPGSDEWQPPVELSEPGTGGGNPRIAVGPGGEQVVVWSGGNEQDQYVVQAATRSAGSSKWHEAEELSERSRTAPMPSVAIGASGEAAIVWERYNPPYYEVEARVRPAGQEAWGPPAKLSLQAAPEPGAADCAAAFRPQVAVDPAGTATAVWECVTASSLYYVQTSNHAPDAVEWSPKQDLSPPSYPGSISVLNPAPQIAASAGGSLAAIWARFEGHEWTIEARAQPPGGGWGPLADLSPPGLGGHYPQVGLDPDGDAAAIWESREGATLRVLAAGYDAAGPQLRQLGIPASGVVGSPLSFSVAPVDVWSGVASVEWAFGDGHTGSGAAASHTYRRPDTYEARVTATDRIGNSTSAGGTVRIDWPPLRQAVARRKP